MSKIEIEKDDVRFYVGIIMLISGEFISKRKLIGFGFQIDSNIIQIAGFILSFWYIFLVILTQIYKLRKGDRRDEN